MKTYLITTNRNANRNGLSFLELIGCLLAAGGGMWFGAMYLGVDVDRVAYEAVRDSGLMESIPDGYKPHPPEGHLDLLSEEELASRLENELVALRHGITALRESNETSTVADHNAGDSADLSGENTLVYWKHLIDIAIDEAALQSSAQSAFSKANADSVFALRGRVSRFAAKAVNASQTLGVSPQAQQLGSQLADWYLRSGKLYDQAAHLWSNENAQQSSAQLTKSWETSERQLNNEAELLSNKASSVRASLSRTYGVEFPEFGG